MCGVQTERQAGRGYSQAASGLEGLVPSQRDTREQQGTACFSPAVPTRPRAP